MIKTSISWAYKDLLITFMKANELDVGIVERKVVPYSLVDLEPKSQDAEHGLTFLGYKHLGVENMLCDYLMRCGISSEAIGKHCYMPKRTAKELDEQWEKHRKEVLGFRQ